MVETQQYGGQQPVIPTTTDAASVWGFANGGGGAKSISFNTKDNFGQNQSLPLGTAFTGHLRKNPSLQQVLDFDTKQPKFYQDNNPVMQLRFELGDVFVSVGGGEWQDIRQAIPSDDDEDDGVRALFVSNQMKRALQDAMTKSGAKTFGVGTRVTVRLVNMVPAKKAGYNPQKVYEVELTEIQPFVSDAEAPAQAALNVPAAGPGQWAPNPGSTPGIQQWAPTAPADPSQGVPQQQSIAPAQPTFPGQVVPQQAPVAPQAAPTAPPQQLPNTGAQLPQPTAAPAAPAAVPQIDPAALAQAVLQVRGVMAQAIPRETALESVAGATGIPREILDQADANTPI